MKGKTPETSSAVGCAWDQVPPAHTNERINLVGVEVICHGSEVSGFEERRLDQRGASLDVVEVRRLPGFLAKAGDYQVKIRNRR